MHWGAREWSRTAAGLLRGDMTNLPFGEEIPLGMNGRAAPYQAGGYPIVPPDVVRKKFSGKERDAETGLDSFGGEVHVLVAGTVYYSGHCWPGFYQSTDSQ